MKMKAVADRTLARENGAWRRGWANKDRPPTPRMSGTAASSQHSGEGEGGGGARGVGEGYLPPHQTGKDKDEHTFSPPPPGPPPIFFWKTKEGVSLFPLSCRFFLYVFTFFGGWGGGFFLYLWRL